MLVAIFLLNECFGFVHWEMIQMQICRTGLYGHSVVRLRCSVTTGLHPSLWALMSQPRTLEPVNRLQS